MLGIGVRGRSKIPNIVNDHENVLQGKKYPCNILLHMVDFRNLEKINIFYFYIILKK